MRRSTLRIGYGFQERRYHAYKVRLYSPHPNEEIPYIVEKLLTT